MLKTVLRRVAYGLLIVVIILPLAYWIKKNNIYPVVPGKVYRSAQLSGDELKQLILAKHLRAVLNLRGSNPQDAWYRNEVYVTNAMGVAHFDVAMRAYVLPQPAVLRKLVAMLISAPRPFVIHCAGGSDRTGLASAIVLLLHNASLKQAERQVSIRYFAYSADSVGRLVLPYYAHWLKQHHEYSTRDHFLQWLAQPVLFRKKYR